MAEPAGELALTEQDDTVISDSDEIPEGLRKPQKTLSPKFFCGEAGSQLFERITELPEYYPTQIELGIMQSRVDEPDRPPTRRSTSRANCSWPRPSR